MADDDQRVACESETQVRMYFSTPPAEGDAQVRPLPTGTGDAASAARIEGSAPSATSPAAPVAATSPVTGGGGGEQQDVRQQVASALLPDGLPARGQLLVLAALLIVAAALFCLVGHRLGKRRV